MDRAFLEYYEEELTHIRALASEFADMHPAIARNLSLDTVPCPDPYVERLLDGVAFLAARTRLKVDAERSRFTRSVLEVLYPDLVAPAPAVGMAILKPGQQVQTMLAGHRRQARHAAGLQPAAWPLHPLHLYDRAGCDAVADQGRFGRLLSGPQRAGRGWSALHRRCGGRVGAAHHHPTRRQGLPQRARPRLARPLLCRTAQGGHHVRHAVRRHRRGWAHASKATTTG